MSGGNINQEPLHMYRCCSCYEDYAWPANELAVHEDAVWCQGCWEDSQISEEEGTDWHDLPHFRPQRDTRIAHLEALCREVVEAKGDRTRWHLGRKLSDAIDKIRKEVG